MKIFEAFPRKNIFCWIFGLSNQMQVGLFLRGLVGGGLGLTVVAVLVVLRDRTLGREFGTSDELGLFLFALSLCGVIAHFMHGALQMALVPYLIKMAESRPEQIESAQRLIFKLARTLLGTGLTCLVSVWSVLFFRYPASRVDLFFFGAVSAALLILLSFSLSFSSLLIARRKLMTNALIPAVAPISLLVCYYCLEHSSIQILSIAYVIGVGIELCMVLLLTRSKRQKIFAHKNVDIESEKYFEIQSSIYTCMISQGCFILAECIDQVIAVLVSAESGVLLNFSLRLPSGISGMLAAMFNPVLIYFISQADFRQKKGTHCELVRNLTVTFFSIGLLVGIIGILWGDRILSVLFEIGALDSHVIQSIVPVQSSYFLSLIFLVASLPSVRYLLVYGRRRTFVSVVMVALGFKILFGALLWRFLGLAALGIGSAVMFLVLTFFSVYVVSTK